MRRSADRIVATRPTWSATLQGAFVLIVPVAVLIAVAVRAGQTPVIAGGVATEAFLALAIVHQVGVARAVSHKTASPVYLIAVLILWMTAKDHQDIYLQIGMFILVGVPLVLFVGQEFIFTNGVSVRRARALVRQLAAKTDWPDDLLACKALPEVKALREALREDAEPVLVLLTHPRPHVRIAALAALEFRPSWRAGQAEKVLQAAKFASEPPVRVAALMALANVDDANMAAMIAVYLLDVHQEVRKAAAVALLWDDCQRWALVRAELHAALSNRRFIGDGPLPLNANVSKTAMADLIVWSGERGPVGRRAALTLTAHYRKELTENPSTEVVDELADRIRDVNFTSALRIEFAQLLVENDCIENSFWTSLLDSGQPSYLRLLAAGALLRKGNDEAALAALREVAAVPNREMAMQVAAIVQKSLRVDMGLPLNGAMPEAKSKLAAEVARRVIDWSAGLFKALPSDGGSRRTRTSSILRQMPKSSGDHQRPRG